MFAVIRTGGKQYRVAKEDVIKIEKISGDVGAAIEFKEVLILGGAGEPAVGSPLVEGATVAGEVLEQGRSGKIIVFKKKRRKNYRRTKGHRQDQTTVKITDILTGGKTAKKSKMTGSAPSKTSVDNDGYGEKSSPDVPSDNREFKYLDRPEGSADDLKKISGVGPKLEEKLNAAGIWHYWQIAAFTEDAIEKIDQELNFKGRIERDDWLSQAKELMKEQASGN